MTFTLSFKENKQIFKDNQVIQWFLSFSSMSFMNMFGPAWMRENVLEFFPKEEVMIGCSFYLWRLVSASWL